VILGAEGVAAARRGRRVNALAVRRYLCIAQNHELILLLYSATTVRLSIEQIQLVIWRRIVVVVVNVLKGAEKLDFLERVDG